jgi:glycosyltransferase involved in cell wall biosynthesis
MNLFRELFQQDHQTQYTLLLTQPEARLEFPNVRQVIYPVRNRFLARILLQAVLPFMAPRYDLIHFTKNLGAFGLRAPVVVTVHDMTTILVPQIFPRSDVLYWRTIEKLTLRGANRIVTVSHDAANDIARIYQIPANKIEVIYHGNSRETTLVADDEIQRVRQAYRIEEPYVICVGRIDPKKNLTAAVRGFQRVKQQRGFPGKLVLVGEMYRKKPDLALIPTIQSLGLEKEVILTGKVPNEDIAPLYAGSFCSLFASLHEGFGLVALEALSCGAPLVTAQAGAVGEVVGDAAIVIPDSSPESIAAGLGLLYDRPEMRAELVRKGAERARSFSWHKAAAQTLALYRECARRS